MLSSLRLNIPLLYFMNKNVRKNKTKVCVSAFLNLAKSGHLKVPKVCYFVLK